MTKGGRKVGREGEEGNKREGRWEREGERVGREGGEARGGEVGEGGREEED